MSHDADLRALERRAALGEPGAAERLALAQQRAGLDDPPMRWPVIESAVGAWHLWTGRRCRPLRHTWTGEPRTACGMSDAQAEYLPRTPHASEHPPTCQRCRSTFAFKYVRARGWHPDPEKKREIDARVPEALRRWVARVLRADAETQEVTTDARESLVQLRSRW